MIFLLSSSLSFASAWQLDFPYFDYDNMKFVKNRMKGIAKTYMEKIEAKIKEVMAAGRTSLNKEEIKTTDNSVHFDDV